MMLDLRGWCMTSTSKVDLIRRELGNLRYFQRDGVKQYDSWVLIYVPVGMVSL